MAMTPELLSIVKKIGVAQDVCDWLIDQLGDVDVDDIAIMASEEGKVKTEIIDKLPGTIAKAKEVGTAVKLTKLWTMCRRAYDSQKLAKTSTDPNELEAPLDDPTKDAMAEKWKLRHTFILADSRLLVESLQARLYRETNATPPRLSVLFLEQLRVLSSPERKSCLALLVKPGEVAKGQAVIADFVEGSFELFIRARAYVTTLSYVSIAKPGWFGFEDAEYFSEKVLHFVNQEVDGSRPPLSYFVTAWVSTMQRFSETVRTTGAPLKDIVRATAGWEHLWTMWRPSNAEKPIPQGSSTGAKDRATENEVDYWRRLASNMQSQRDNALKRTSNAVQPENFHNDSGGDDQGGGRGRGRNNRRAVRQRNGGGQGGDARGQGGDGRGEGRGGGRGDGRGGARGGGFANRNGKRR